MEAANVVCDLYVMSILVLSPCYLPAQGLARCRGVVRRHRNSSYGRSRRYSYITGTVPFRNDQDQNLLEKRPWSLPGSKAVMWMDTMVIE
jgi:hypothetical protein